MTKSLNDDLRKIVNASGFLFQLRVEDEIRRTHDDHNWSVSSHEHPWKNQKTGIDGFIDLVIEQSCDRIVIECKRVKDANWIFLIPSKSNFDIKKTRCLYTFQEGNTSSPSSGWHDFDVLPSSKQAEFCIVRGQGENDKSMLERIAFNLLNAVDSFALEELGIRTQQSKFGIRLYFPLIVTTANLQTCEFETNQISLEDGTLPDDAGAFKTVPYIRFHKSLTTSLSPNYNPPDVMSANKDKERTIFIVQAQELISFLKAWRIEETARDRHFYSTLI